MPSRLAAMGLGAALSGALFPSAPSRAAEGVASPVTPVMTASAVGSTCDLIAQAAQRYDLPLDYFTRLIWQESGFRSDVVSRSGAKGIAQFMPDTAAERGLADPFEKADALVKSAAYLHELRLAFGNLGLAAAAYNAGRGRLSRWLAGGDVDLPRETYNYVSIVTGRALVDWRGSGEMELAFEGPAPCGHLADLAARLHGKAEPALAVTSISYGSAGRLSPPGGSPPGAQVGLPPIPKGWAVVLVGHPQREMAFSEYQMVRGRFSKILGPWRPSIVHRHIGGSPIVRYVVQIERETRAGADSLCAQLLRAGGACFVLANRS